LSACRGGLLAGLADAAAAVVAVTTAITKTVISTVRLVFLTRVMVPPENNVCSVGRVTEGRGGNEAVTITSRESVRPRRPGVSGPAR